MYRKHRVGNELTNILLLPEQPNNCCCVFLTCPRARFGFPRRWCILRNHSWGWSITGTTRTASWAAGQSWASSQHMGPHSSWVSASWKLKIKKLWRNSYQLLRLKGMWGMQQTVWFQWTIICLHIYMWWTRLLSQSKKNSACRRMWFSGGIRAGDSGLIPHPWQAAVCLFMWLCWGKAEGGSCAFENWCGVFSHKCMWCKRIQALHSLCDAVVSLGFFDLTTCYRIDLTSYLWAADLWHAESDNSAYCLRGA